MYQFNIVFGILLAFFSNYLLQGVGGDNDWRWMLGVMALPALIYTLMVTRIPESPRWLLTAKNDAAGARTTLIKLGTEDVETEMKAIMESHRHQEAGQHSGHLFHAYRKLGVSPSCWHF
jgi:MFS family permease